MKKVWILYPERYDLSDEFASVVTDDEEGLEALKTRMSFIWGNCVGVYETTLNGLSDELVALESEKIARHKKEEELLEKMKLDKAKGPHWINKDGSETPVKS